eukprot:755393-Hanusia_phi.AAC.4
MSMKFSGKGEDLYMIQVAPGLDVALVSLNPESLSPAPCLTAPAAALLPLPLRSLCSHFSFHAPNLAQASFATSRITFTSPLLLLRSNFARPLTWCRSYA